MSDAKISPTNSALDRRRGATAGHTGDIDVARQLTTHPDADVRATAYAALCRLRALTPSDFLATQLDASADVRRRSAEWIIQHQANNEIAVPHLVALTADQDAMTVETACWAIGELAQPPDVAIQAVIGAASHMDPLVREAAVAALGAMGDPRGLPAILNGTLDKPAIRRRAVLALSPFDGPDVDATLQRALTDRDWQVRQAAEDLLD